MIFEAMKHYDIIKSNAFDCAIKLACAVFTHSPVTFQTHLVRKMDEYETFSLLYKCLP